MNFRLSTLFTTNSSYRESIHVSRLTSQMRLLDPARAFIRGPISVKYVCNIWDWNSGWITTFNAKRAAQTDNFIRRRTYILISKIEISIFQRREYRISSCGSFVSQLSQSEKFEGGRITRKWERFGCDSSINNDIFKYLIAVSFLKDSNFYISVNIFALRLSDWYWHARLETAWYLILKWHFPKRDIGEFFLILLINNVRVPETSSIR